MLNLNEPEVRRLMATVPAYSDARLVAEAYERNQPAEWVSAVYAQAVLNGNLAFAEHHALVGRPPGNFYIELVNRFRADPVAQQRGPAVLNNLRRTLETCADAVVQYAFGTASAEFLRKRGNDVEFKTYRGMGHSARDDELRDIAAFLKERLPPV